jgi:hypothetical protein
VSDGQAFNTERYACTCEAPGCEWVHVVEGNHGRFNALEMGKILIVLHTLKRHPERYQLLGTLPIEEAQRLYHPYMKKYGDLV